VRGCEGEIIGGAVGGSISLLGVLITAMRSVIFEEERNNFEWKLRLV